MCNIASWLPKVLLSFRTVSTIGPDPVLLEEDFPAPKPANTKSPVPVAPEQVGVTLEEIEVNRLTYLRERERNQRQDSNGKT